MKRPGYKYALFLLDGILINVSFILAVRIHTLMTDATWFRVSPEIIPEILFWMMCSFVTMFIFVSRDLYKINIILGGTQQIQAIIKAMMISLIAVAVIAYFGKSVFLSTSKMVLALFFLFSTVSLIISRLFIFHSFFNIMRRHNRFHRRVIILGAGIIGRHFARLFASNNPLALDLIAVLDDREEAGTVLDGGVTIVGKMNDVDSIVRRERIDEIIVCCEGETDDRILDLVDRCASTRARVLICSPEYRVVPDFVLQERYDGIEVFGMKNASVYMGVPLFKRIVDLAGAACAILLLLPVLLAIAIVIKLESPGPVLFRQKRIGKNGKPFTFYKFRSMVTGSDNDPERVEKLKAFIKHGYASGGKSTKIVDEGKVTNVGRFLRKTSLDELPQFLNVLRGDMSLVGPRPCLPYEWEQYAMWQKRRLSVTPGCTGLWQVVARSRVGFRDMVILDIFYANNISFHFDAWLMIRTLPVMLFGTGGK